MNPSSESGLWENLALLYKNKQQQQQLAFFQEKFNSIRTARDGSSQDCLNHIRAQTLFPLGAAFHVIQIVFGYRRHPTGISGIQLLTGATSVVMFNGCRGN